MQVLPSRQIHQQPQTNQDQCSDLDIFEMLASVLVTSAKSEQILQCMREVLVNDPTFTPMTLFKYLAGNSAQISRKNIIAFLDENNLVENDRQTDDILKKIFSKYGINTINGTTYTGFLNFVYPYNSGILRQLLNSKIKKYPQLQKIQKSFRPSQSVITAFLLLLEEEIKVQRRIQIQINDSRFPKKQKLRKVIKSIKRASQKLSNAKQNQQIENTISMTELRNFIKTFIEVEDHIFLDLGRKLGLSKSGQISMQSLQNVLKKIKRATIQPAFIVDEEEYEQLNESQQRIRQKSKVRIDKQRNKSENKQIKQISFRQQLYKELATTLKVNQPNKIRTPRAKSANRTNKNKTPIKRGGAAINNDISGLGNGMYGVENLGNICQSKQQHNQLDKWKNIDKTKERTAQTNAARKPNQNNSANNLFKQFVQIFLKGNKQIQSCKSKLAATGHIDYLTLFKTLDNGKGVTDAKSLRDFYIKLSGIDIDYDFQLLIDRFAQSQEKWLSFSEFSEIFRSQFTRGESTSNSNCASLRSSSCHDINGIKISPEAIRLLSQILFLTLELQQSLHKIVHKFKKSQIQQLFSRINIDSQSKGFINYQQLKRYLSQQLGMSIQMIDLMALLKRLDKSKNGVVVRQQFLTF